MAQMFFPQGTYYATLHHGTATEDHEKTRQPRDIDNLAAPGRVTLRPCVFADHCSSRLKATTKLSPDYEGIPILRW